MGNYRSSPLNFCQAKHNPDGLMNSMDPTSGENIWLTLPVVELAGKMIQLREKSLRERESLENRVEVRSSSVLCHCIFHQVDPHDTINSFKLSVILGMGYTCSVISQH